VRFCLFPSLIVVACLAGCADEKVTPDNLASFSISAADHEQFPDMMFIAEPAKVRDGDSVTLRWTAGSSDQCLASGGWEGSRAASGVESSGPLQEDTVFLLSCSQGDRAGMLKVQVEVQAITPDVELASTHDLVPLNGRATLHWQAQGARICRASGGWQGELPVAGSWQTGPLNRSTIYHLSCISDAGTALTSISIGVLPSAGIRG